MPIVEATIKQQIEQLVESSSEKDPEIAKQEFYNGLATIIANSIRSAQVNPGIPVTVATPSGPGTGTTTGPGTLS